MSLAVIARHGRLGSGMVGPGRLGGGGGGGGCRRLCRALDDHVLVRGGAVVGNLLQLVLQGDLGGHVDRHRVRDLLEIALVDDRDLLGRGEGRGGRGSGRGPRGGGRGAREGPARGRRRGGGSLKLVITFWGMSVHLWLRLFFLVLLLEDGRGGHLLLLLLLLLLLEGHRGVGGLRVGHVVLDDHLVVDGIVGRGGGLSIRRGAPAPAAAATPAALWALGAAVGGFKDSWVSGCGL